MNMFESGWNRICAAALVAMVAASAPLSARWPAGIAPRAAEAAKKLSVVTTTQDLASIATAVGGDRVQAESLSKGYQDPHFVDAKPSYLVKLKKADLFVEVGRDLEVGWIPGLLNSARNSRVLPGGAGFVDASTGIQVMELGNRVGREQGDVHPLGNPHYWLDPENGVIAARNIRDGLSRISPADAGYFQSRYAEFEKELRERQTGWKKRAQEIGLSGARVVTYHRSWPYYARAFGFQVLDYVEPKPGVPPAPRHVQDLMASMKQQQVKFLFVEPYFDPKLPTQIARNTGAALVILPPSVGAVPEATDYFKLFDVQLDLIQKAARGS